MRRLEEVEKSQMRTDLSDFKVGDTVKVHFKVLEGGRTRSQVLQGIVISKKGSRARETFTVRKISFGVGVERTFPVHSPKISKIKVVTRGKVKKSKLYYLREKVGKQAKVKRKKQQKTKVEEVPGES